MPVRRSFPRRLLAAAALTTVLAGTACTSRDEQAATAAGLAGDALGNGDLRTARFQIAQALAARDDVSDYWLLSGRIAMAAGDYHGAYDAFEGALTLDRGNLEALTRVCQIAVSANSPERAERYADQLLALHPGDTAAITVQAAAAAQRGDKAGARRLLAQVFATTPNDPAALIVQARLLAADGDNTAAAKAVETSLTAPGDPVGRLVIARDFYAKAGDVAGWRRTIARLARAQPQSAPAQIDYAASLYAAGDAAGGLALSKQALALMPGDVATADAVLRLWLAQGRAAMPVDAIMAGATGAVPETRAAFATYADALNRPDLALQALGDAGGNADVAVARGRAQFLLGHRDEAAAAVAAVLAADADQSRALALRAALRAAGGDRDGAVGDLRHALAANPLAVDARLALADLQAAGGDRDLAASTLRDGLIEQGDQTAAADPRLAARLAALLRQQGRDAEAAGVLTEYARTHPFAKRPG